ncbi:MAG: ATP-binding cassette domain-containing protein [Gemmatimonadota bacterium]|nr:ATP-binding cassette domain-containing protein [Gemmatimonadota bacterium]
MSLVSLQDVRVAFGGPPVLHHADFAIERGERVCLLGRNGAGKSTFMKVLDGTQLPDSGAVVKLGGITMARLDQEMPPVLTGSMFEVVAEGLGERGRLLTAYHAASLRVSVDHSEAALRDLDRLHRALDAADAWQLHIRVETVLEHLGLDPEARIEHASGGRTRQALLARALVCEPDLILLDEPTNHLDIEAIEWMEEYLTSRGLTLIFVTHDRAFLRRVATRIVELDRGRLVDFGTDYDTYLERKDAMLASEAKSWEEFDKRLAKEEVWIRTGIQARRTRNEGRVRGLEALRVERSQRRERVGTTRAQAQDAERSGRMVIEANAISFSHGPKPIVSALTTTIMRGDRVGLVGPNGCGKTTLIKLLLGDLEPQSGTIRHGTNLEVAYFDQRREQLDPERSVFDSIADGADFVTIGGQPRHVNGYLQDFLFPPERARTPVRALSGGERNRLLLARLFTRAFNVLVLDEPTNDLDIETLDVLESLLNAFSGTLLLVSHDRAFLDAVVSSTLVFEGKGVVREYVGGYTDWLRQRAVVAPPPGAAAPRRAEPVAVSTSPSAKKRKLSYKEQQELAALPDRIAAAEAELAQGYASLADPAVIRDPAVLATLRRRVAELEAAIPVLMERWEALETILAESAPS